MSALKWLNKLKYRRELKSQHPQTSVRVVHIFSFSTQKLSLISAQQKYLFMFEWLSCKSLKQYRSVHKFTFTKMFIISWQSWKIERLLASGKNYKLYGSIIWMHFWNNILFLRHWINNSIGKFLSRIVYFKIRDETGKYSRDTRTKY